MARNDPVLPNAPSRTAEMVCWCRAADQFRPPEARIVDDPFATLFLSPPFRAALAAYRVSGRLGDLAEAHSPGLFAYVLARHRFIDDALVRALAAQGSERIEQVVLLGAGYDARAYRYARELADRPVFELDFPATSRRKAEILAQHRSTLPAANVRVVEIDFTQDALDARLLEAGFRSNARTFFVWEGVSMYLTREAVKTTLQTLRTLGGPAPEIAADFWFMLDTHGLTGALHRLSPNFLLAFGEPATFGIHPEDVGPFLAGLGFQLEDLADAAELARRYVREPRPLYPGLYVTRARGTAPPTSRRFG